MQLQDQDVNQLLHIHVVNNYSVGGARPHFETQSLNGTGFYLEEASIRGNTVYYSSFVLCDAQDLLWLDPTYYSVYCFDCLTEPCHPLTHLGLYHYSCVYVRV